MAKIELGSNLPTGNENDFTRDLGSYLVLLLSTIGLAVVGSSLVLHLCMAINPEIIDPEQVDRLVWIVAAIVVSISICASFFEGVRSKIYGLRSPIFMTTLAILLLTIGVTWTEFVPSFPIDIQIGWWHGFGPGVALGTAILIPVLAALNFPAAVPAIRLLVLAGIIVTLVWYLPVMINPPWSADMHHADPVLNDVLAPYVGKFPLADQIPQYTSLLGFPLSVLLPLVDLGFGRSVIPLAATAYLGVLALSTVAIIVWVAFRILPYKFRGLAPFLVLPVMLVSGGDRGSIGESLSAFPARMFLPVLVLLALLFTLRHGSLVAHIAVGVLAGASVLNNPELGTVATIATLAVVLVRKGRGRLLKAAGLISGAAVAGALYWLLSLFSGEGVQFSLFAGYARGFADGFYALPMPVVGTFVIVLMIGGSAAALGAVSIANASSGRLERAGVVSLFAGLMTIGSFAYYVGRSSSTGQLQALLPFVALSIVGIVGILGLPNLWLDRTWSSTAKSVAVLMIPAFAIASVIQAPNPRSQWGKIVPDSDTSFMLAGREVIAEIETIVEMEKSAGDNGAIPLAVNNSNIASALLDLPNASPVNYLADATISSTLRDALCDQLRASTLPVIVDSADGLVLNNLCEGMTVERTYGSQWLVVTFR